MIEVRAIRESEGPAFLRLLCSVFELDYDRASGIFFNEPLFDLNRKWALFEGADMVCILTTVPLEFGWGRAIGIAGVATRPDRQRQGLAAQLLESVLKVSKQAGEGPTLLFAKDDRLYRSVGFEVLDSVVRGQLTGTAELGSQEMLTFSEIRQTYDHWSHRHRDRLRRDDRRWAYWKWNLRVCTEFSDGYFCHEGATVREIVYEHSPPFWSFPPDTDWVGLRTMADRLQLPLEAPLHELHLMGFGFPAVPQIFMTDQF
ncbi:MAG: GNAT family N-acetyltransferase [Fimbriimonadaceae bacterium]|nr:GNAT family N-acetyltransferase [Fimbriimonadaceae bacterium]